jgi:hypothetical protein
MLFLMKKLPDLLENFIRSVTPTPDHKPLYDLQERYILGREEERRKTLTPSGNFPHGSVEFMVEMRIRDWVRRMEAEKAEIERIRKAGQKDAEKKPDNKPDKKSDSGALPHNRPPSPN